MTRIVTTRKMMARIQDQFVPITAPVGTMASQAECQVSRIHEIA